MVILAGLLVRGWAAGVLEKDRELAVSGPYAFTRNPLYLGSFVIGVGAAVAGGRIWIGVVFLAFFIWAYRGPMAREGARLEERFGEAYRRYRGAVPAFLPRLTPYRPTAAPTAVPTRFSLARYVRNREWEAALGRGGRDGASGPQGGGPPRVTGLAIGPLPPPPPPGAASVPPGHCP